MSKMTKDRLGQYLSLKAELRELQEQLRHVGDGDSLIGHDVINDYRTGYAHPQAVIGPDWENLSKKVERFTKMIDKIRKECEEIECFIDDIPDSHLRRIFRMRYVEGKSQRIIARKLNLDQSRISRKIDDYLKVA